MDPVVAATYIAGAGAAIAALGAAFIGGRYSRGIARDTDERDLQRSLGRVEGRMTEDQQLFLTRPVGNDVMMVIGSLSAKVEGLGADFGEIKAEMKGHREELQSHRAEAARATHDLLKVTGRLRVDLNRLMREFAKLAKSAPRT